MPSERMKHSIFIQSTLAHLIAATLLSLGPKSVCALDVSIRPQVRLGMRGTDNILFTAANQEAALGFDNGGGALLTAESSSWLSTVNPTFNFRRFLIGENIDADEYGVRTQHTWMATDNLKPELKLDYIRDSTLTTELTDAGRRNDVANRTSLTVQPSVTYLWDAVTSLTASFVHSDVDFESAQPTGLVAFTFDQANLTVSRILTPDLQAFASIFASDFQAPDLESATRTYGAQTGLTYQYSADLAFDFAGGYVTSNIEFVDRFLALVVDPFPRIVVVQQAAEASNSGPIASASIRKSFENMQGRFDYVRRVSPSSRGAQTLEDDMTLTLDRKLSRQFRTGFRGSYNIRSAELEAVGGTIGVLNRNQALVSGYVSYQWSEQIAVRAEYRFVRQQVTEADLTLYSNAVFLTLNFNGDPYFLPWF